MKKTLLTSLCLSLLASAQSWTGTNPTDPTTHLGNVGIGSSNTPSAALDIMGDLKLRLPSNKNFTIYNGNSTGTYLQLLNTTVANRHEAGSLEFGSGSLLRNNQGGSLELGGNDAALGTGMPYVDFHSSNKAEDFNVRLINDGDKKLTLQGAFKINAGANPSALYVNGGMRLGDLSGDFSMNGAGAFKIDGSGLAGGRFTIQAEGNVGIGTGSPVAKLHVNGLTLLGPDPGTALLGQLNNCAAVPVDNAVPPLRLFANGTIGCLELRVNPTSWCDYVFEKDYKLKALSEVETYIQTYKHLPEVPSEKEVKDQGVYVSEMFKAHMKKIEELTLYMIAQDKKMQEQEQKIVMLMQENEKMAAQFKELSSPAAAKSHNLKK